MPGTPAAATTPPVIQGWLAMKLGVRVKWTKCFFSFDAAISTSHVDVVYHFAVSGHQETTDVHSRLDLTGGCKARISIAPNARQTELELETATKTYRLDATDAHDQQKWIDFFNGNFCSSVALSDTPTGPSNTIAADRQKSANSSDDHNPMRTLKTRMRAGCSERDDKREGKVISDAIPTKQAH